MVRAFIGVVLTEDIKSYVIRVQDQLKSLPMEAKLVEPENLHISLSFLGEIEGTKIIDITSKLDAAAKDYEKFEISIGGISLIPNENFVRVIALDVKSEKLESIRKEVVAKVGGDSHPAHLTLARVKVISDKNKFIEQIRKISPEGISAKVESLDLVESLLQPSGPVYKTAHKSYLK